MDWGDQQKLALREVGAWLAECRGQMRRRRSLTRPVFRMFGHAGTGKTTLATHLAQGVNTPVFGAFTGKAALMMQRKGCTDAKTLHSLIYKADEQHDGTFDYRINRASEAAKADLIVVDEVSMVNEELGRDLMSFDRPILVLGDPGQLPPVSGSGFFTDKHPDVMLTEIHRQARDNPIIYMATEVRENRRLSVGTYGESRVVERNVLSGREVVASDQVIVGRNDTRSAYNKKMRALLGFEGQMPEDGDKLVCLRNDRSFGLLNGGLHTVTEVLHRRSDDQHIVLEVESDDFNDRPRVEVKVRREFFLGTATDIPPGDLKGTQQFDFGYALTCHKSQGSQWSNIIVFDEGAAFRENANRWRYTAITRAAERITVVI